MKRPPGNFLSATAILLFSIGVLWNVAAAQKRPPIPYSDLGACPFECCTYRQWTVEKPTTVRTSMRKGSPIAFHLRRGEKVRGVTGVVITSNPGIARAVKPIDLGDIKLASGDRIFLYTNEGEGYVKAWYRGRFFGAEALDPGQFEIERQPKSVWWVKLRNSRGQIGWSREPENFGNVDQCG